jgi:hypothetical protein
MFSRNVDNFLQLLHGTLQIPIKTRNLIWNRLYGVWCHEALWVTHCGSRFPFQAQNMRRSEHSGCCRQKQAFTAVRVKKSCWVQRKCWLKCLLKKSVTSILSALAVSKETSTRLWEWKGRFESVSHVQTFLPDLQINVKLLPVPYLISFCYLSRKRIRYHNATYLMSLHKIIPLSCLHGWLFNDHECGM